MSTTSVPRATPSTTSSSLPDADDTPTGNIKPFIQQANAGEAPDEVDAWISDFNQFKEKIKTIFRVLNEPTIAQRDIQRIKQTRSAADYAADFQQIAANTDWDDTALMTMFQQGLKPKVKEELMRTSASTKTLNQLINTAININIKLYKLQQELQDDPRARGQRGNRYSPNTSRRVHSATNSGYYRNEAIDLSNLNKGPKRWNKKSPGSKGTDNNKVTRQLNMLTSNDADASEWEVLTKDVGRLMEDSTCPEDSDEEYIVPKRPATPQLTPHKGTQTEVTFDRKANRRRTKQALLEQQQRVVDAVQRTLEQGYVAEEDRYLPGTAVMLEQLDKQFDTDELTPEDWKEITGLQLSQEAENKSDDEEPQAALSPAERARTWLSDDHSRQQYNAQLRHTELSNVSWKINSDLLTGYRVQARSQQDDELPVSLTNDCTPARNKTNSTLQVIADYRNNRHYNLP
ncbi:hypothetical protein OPT61_g6374 [Boeremia exigua]|uniref:Uncharacterized protein n=1 Tax=Boeremia exigua TaxID=749465 RepID=A0ACC2I6Z1_9PLEO|nr:hypothetical protein OPT61_g6374 [Boeremia exigua]